MKTVPYRGGQTGFLPLEDFAENCIKFKGRPTKVNTICGHKLQCLCILTCLRWTWFFPWYGRLDAVAHRIERYLLKNAFCMG